MTITPIQRSRDVVAETMERITRARGAIHPSDAHRLTSLLNAFWRDELHGELELRLGRRMTEGLSGAELDEFDAVSTDDEAAWQWIEGPVQHYRQIVSEEIERLVADTADAFASVGTAAEWEEDAHV